MKRKKRKLEIKRSSIFDGNKSDRDKLARHIVGLAKANHVSSSTLAEKISPGKNSSKIQVSAKIVDTTTESSYSEAGSLNGTDSLQSRFISHVENNKEQCTSNINEQLNDDQGAERIGESDTLNRRNSSLIVAYSSSSESGDE